MSENYETGQNSIVTNSAIGVGTKVWHNVNIYDAKIGENCTIGSFSEIGGSKIGDNCKVEAHVFIPPNIEIGNNVFIGPRVSFANDKYPSATGDWEPRKTVVEDNVSIGIASTILPGVRLGKGCMVGGGAVVTKDVAPGTLVVGVPAKVMKNLQTEVKLDIAPEEEKRIRIASPHIDYDTIEEVSKVLQSGQWVQGKKVKEFEEKFAEYVGTKHAIAVSNGTLALHLALIAAGVGSGDEVITTPFSFVATANAILMCGATPVFVDIDPKTYNINPDLIENEITTRTKAVLPVHLYGNPCDILKIKSICMDHNLKLVEDACQAHGAKVGLSTACYSFYATKNLACGEGGMITTDDEKLANFVRKLRQHGGQQKYAPEYLGFNYRMTDISATIGLGNLTKLDEFTKKRRENAELLTSLLKDVRGLATPCCRASSASTSTGSMHSDFESVFHQYTIRVLPEYPLSRDELASKLSKEGIDTSLFYPLSLNKMPHVIRTAGEASCPVAELASKEVLSLPIHPSVSMADIKRIAATLSEL